MKLSVFKSFSAIPKSDILKQKIPVFATQEYANFLKELQGANTIWFGLVNNIEVELLIPFSSIKKGIFKKGKFLTGVISFEKKSSAELEKLFLNKIVQYIKENRLCDWIQKGPNWALFNAYPDGAVFAPFGTYRINLKEYSVEELYSRLNGRLRTHINKVLREKKIQLKSDENSFKDGVTLINDTLKNNYLTGISERRFKLLNKHLKDYLICYTAYFEDEPHSSLIYLLNSYCTYGRYAGSKVKAINGATNLIVWESIRISKERNINYYDFVGARINPDIDTKQYRIQRGKSYYGPELVEGFIWKMTINNFRFNLFNFLNSAIKILKGKKNKGDIIDQEIKRFSK